MTTSPDASAWLTFDQTSFTISGSPTLAQVGNYTVEIIAEDLDVLTSNGSTTFILIIDDHMDADNWNYVLGINIDYIIPAGAFGIHEAAMTDVVPTIEPDVFGLTYDSSTRNVKGSHTYQSKTGNYTMTLTAMSGC